ncbi:MAG: putative prolyl oligopeptidase family protein PpcE [Pseudomonadota bacterium]|jgi:prolyl oligopeptidase
MKKKLLLAAAAATAITATGITATTVAGPAVAQNAAAPAKAPTTQNTPSTPVADAEAKKDEFLWLEEVEGERALTWVRAQNEEAFKRLRADSRYEGLRADAEKILTARDRIPYGSLAGGMVDNFWQDQTHVRGIWRRTTVENYRTETPAWETVLDIDALSKAENENWVYKGGSCLPPANRRCLVNLSRGGKDAVVIREFDAETKTFLEGGFVLPEAKQSAAWIDENTLLVSTETGGDSMTTSGYPRQVRLWTRGQTLEQTKIVFSGTVEDMGVWPGVSHRPEGTVAFVSRRPAFFTEEIHVVEADGKTVKLNLPAEIESAGMIGGDLLVQLRADWAVAGKTHPKGTLVAVPLAEAKAGVPKTVAALYTPTETSAIRQIGIAQDAVYVALLENVTGKLLKLTKGQGGWTTDTVPVPANGNLSIVSTDDFSRDVLLNFDSFLQPSTLYHMAAGGAPEAIKALPARFDAAPFTTEQRFATSKDGTRIPYFIIRGKALAENGDNPTLLYGYGGFEIPMTPSYMGPLGKQWLEAGGVYVVANIRGGGEFGPRWHQAALKENRQKAFDDFIAVAEHLVETKVTQPRRLGIYGGSNGGLLMGAVMTQRPELFNAVAIAVPLLDMLRYHTLLAGASWMAEYGNPEIPAEKQVIAAYSPYQRLSKEATYPEAYIFTSTKDDRVHPGHARKFAARMAAQGHPMIYFENIEGGHSAAANLAQRAENNAQLVVYLMQKLMDAPKASN